MTLALVRNLFQGPDLLILLVVIAIILYFRYNKPTKPNYSHHA